MNRFLELLQGQKPIIADGAMGTILNQRINEEEHCFERLNITQPGLVAEVHREYIDAGSKIILANTFGANRYKLMKFGLENDVTKINLAAVDLLRKVVSASFQEILIAGDVGPLGVRIAPFGRVQLEEAREAFREQINTLNHAGVDLIVIETMSDFYEIREAILASKEVNPSLPVLASMTFTRDDRTLLGDTPEKIAQLIHDTGADVIGINCSGGPLQLLRLLKKMRKAVTDANFSVMPNAGWPEQQEGRIMYPAGADYFGQYAIAFWQAGAKVIGGCCGTTPLHIQAMASEIKNTNPTDIIVGLEIIEDRSKDAIDFHREKSMMAEKLEQKRFVISVEMDPPKGLSTEKLLAGASLLKEAGADVINVADSPMARMRMSPWAVCKLIQETVKVETVLHFPTRGRNLLRVQGDLLAAHALGIRNVFVVMGDPTSIGDYPNAMDNYDLVPSGLVKLIKQSLNSGLDHAGAQIGQPTSFFVGSALNLSTKTPETELKNLKRKLSSGADFVLTQPVYDLGKTIETLDWFRNQLEQDLYVIIGILPLVTDRHANFLHHEVPGIQIPDDIMNRMKKSGSNSASEGIKIAIEQINTLKEVVQGVYLMPAFNRFDYAAEIIEAIR